MKKADDKVEYEDEKGKMQAEKYSHFQYLETQVEVLKEQVELIGDILDQNNLVKTTKEEASIDVIDATYRKLEEDD